MYTNSPRNPYNYNSNGNSRNNDVYGNSMSNNNNNGSDGVNNNLRGIRNIRNTNPNNPNNPNLAIINPPQLQSHSEPQPQQHPIIYKMDNLFKNSINHSKF